jgi:hypothetical protein
MTAFGKPVGMLRMRKNGKSSEGNKDRPHDESNRTNPNNSVVNTIELTDIKNGEFTINSSII